MYRKRPTLPETSNEPGEPSTSPLPSEFYNNDGQSRVSERMIALQEQSPRDQRQRYQQYQQYQQIPSGPRPLRSHDTPDRFEIAGTEVEEEENTDFWQEAFVPKSGSNKPHEDVDASTSPNLTQNEPSEKVNPPLRRSESALETRKPKHRHRSEKKDFHEARKPSVSDRLKNNRPRPNADGNNPATRTEFEAENQLHPQRSKSLVRPERARSTLHRRNTVLKQDNDGGIEKPRNLHGAGDERRRPPERRNPKKWYQCEFPSAWIMFSRCITCWAPSCFLSCFGLRDRLSQQAWREKIALVFIILVHCAAVGFLTFGLTQAFCGIPPARVRVQELSLEQSTVLGKVYDVKGFVHPKISGHPDDEDLNTEDYYPGRRDITFMFQVIAPICNKLFVSNITNKAPENYFPCVKTDEFSTPNPLENVGNQGCHIGYKTFITQLKYIGELYYDWDYITRKDRDFIVYNGQVLDLDRLKWVIPTITVDERISNLAGSKFKGRDVTYYLQRSKSNEEIARCLLETIRVGVVDTSSIGCVITNVITDVSLIVIVAVVLVRFFLAVLFRWVLSWRLGNFREETAEDIAKRNQAIDKWEDINNHVYDPNGRDSRVNSSTSFNFMNKSRFSTQAPIPTAPSYRRRDGRLNSRQVYSGQLGPGEKKFRNGSASSLIHQLSTNGSSAAANNDMNNESQTPSINDSRTDSLTSSSQGSYQNSPIILEQRFNFDLMHTIMLVTCYSEGRQGIKTTLDSLAATDYPTSHKIIMCIADGMIYGVGNRLSTPEICLSLMSDLIVPEDKVRAHSYVAIADGKKRHNMAKVYAGYYKYHDHDDPQKSRRIPMITLVKCGGPGENNDPKPGNRGKRDSQVVLISFLQKVMFDERMTPLEYEFFNAIRAVSGVTPDCYELVLMVDADTKIFPDSLTRMVACMSRDPGVMGLCGETRIANKSDSWVTRIQVFEYYISHHMQKAFESIFGGVTCLPGCFCMYRIKAPKGPRGYWVPILANPDIVELYSENIVDTLHKKNLLLLGEDRYLSTLMLRTFPKRKMVFVPQAVCKTIVPDTFKVLRSQRRRWINSTVHNLLELVLIPELCGIFCFSMQFVIFMELVGTIVLPAAISFTMYLIVISIFERPIPWVPLALLAVVLGLPALLILLTTRRLIYVGWMIIYLFSLPIWNFVLPIYAYWHFDDFSWGQTRVVEGEESGADHSRKQGEFDSSKIVMKRWAEWEREKYLYYRNSLQRYVQSSSDDGYIPSSTRPSSSSTIYGSEKSQIYPAQPINSPLNPRGNRGRSHTTDSLMLPPSLSNNNLTPDSEINSFIPLQGFNENIATQVPMPRAQRNNNSSDINNIPSDNNASPNENYSPRQYL